MSTKASDSLLQRRKNAVPNGVGVFNTATVKEAKNATIIDVNGNELIDFAGGIGVVNAGHCPEPVIEAIIEQTKKYIHTSFNVVTYEPYIELCETLNELFPHGENDVQSYLYWFWSERTKDLNYYWIEISFLILDNVLSVTPK